MQAKGKSKWMIITESVYTFGREERLQAAYEIVLPAEKIALKGRKKDAQFEASENRFVCSSLQ
jgi:hypothetical protein